MSTDAARQAVLAQLRAADQLTLDLAAVSWHEHAGEPGDPKGVPMEEALLGVVPGAVRGGWSDTLAHALDAAHTATRYAGRPATGGWQAIKAVTAAAVLMDVDDPLDRGEDGLRRQRVRTLVHRGSRPGKCGHG